MGLIILLVGLLLTMWAQWKVRSSFQKWSHVPATVNLTGKEIARNILDQHGLTDVRVEPIRGFLTDHYDPTQRVVRLSEAVYEQSSVAAISVAAHECGHAIQHQEDYGALVLRHRLMPLFQFTSGLAPWLILAGLFFQVTGLFLLGILFFSVAVLFHLITLPIEFNASTRAEKILLHQSYIDGNEQAGVREVLGSAAFTYVASALIALMELFRFIMIFMLQRDRD